MTRRENEAVTFDALGTAFEPYFQTEPQLRDKLQLLICSGNKSDGERYTEELADLLDNEALQDQMAADPLFIGEKRVLTRLIPRLSHNYIMFARMPDTGGRTLVRWESQLPHASDAVTALKPARSADAWIQRQTSSYLLEWPRLEIDFADSSTARSSHIEVVLPDGVSPVNPLQDGNHLDSPHLIKYGQLPNAHGEPDETTRQGQREGQSAGSRLHFASTSEEDIPAHAVLNIPVRPTRAGWLTASWFLTSVALTLSLAVGVALYVDAGSDESLQLEFVNSIIAALVSVGSATAARRDSHELVNRVQQRYRVMLVVVSALLLAAAILSPIVSEPWDWAVWIPAALTSAVFWLVQSVGFYARRYTFEPVTWWSIAVITLFGVVLLATYMWHYLESGSWRSFPLGLLLPASAVTLVIALVFALALVRHVNNTDQTGKSA